MIEFDVDVGYLLEAGELDCVVLNDENGEYEPMEFVPKAESGTCEMKTDWDYLHDGIPDAPEDTWAYMCSACGWSFRYDRGVKPKHCPDCGCKVVER